MSKDFRDCVPLPPSHPERTTVTLPADVLVTNMIGVGFTFSQVEDYDAAKEWAARAYEAGKAAGCKQAADAIAEAIEHNVRNPDWDKQDRGGYVGIASKMAYVAGHDKAAQIAREYAEGSTDATR